jgi:flagellar hook-associated protein 3 FlgL
MRISNNQMYNQGLTNILNQQANAAKTQKQLATGKRVLTPSDDPIAASRIELLKKRISFSERMIENQNAAKSALSVEESLLSSSITTLQKVRQLQVQAGNGSLNSQDKQSIANEVNQLLKQLVGIANTQDTSGHYIFSGAQTLTKAVTLNGSGNYVFNGDETVRQMRVSNGLSVQLNDSAADIFMRIPKGNGIFSVSDNGAANSGSGVISNGSIVDNAQYVAEDYTISFALNSSSELVVMVSGTSSGNIIPPSGLADDAPLYVPGQSINFNGIEISVEGSPQAGDDFTIQPADSESIFSTMQRMLSNLANSSSTDADKAKIQNENNQILAQIDNAITNIVDVQSKIGARLNVLDIADDINQDFILSSKEQLTSLEDIDLAEAAVNLNAQTIALQAAQQSYARIQQLSLFNVL